MATMEVKQALKSLEDAEGRLTPEGVVKAAADSTSPLHALFEWDNKKAAHQHRIEQARSLIRSIKVEIHTDRRIIRTVGYVHDPEAERQEQGYRSILNLRTERDNARAAMVNEFAQAAAHLRRAREVASALEFEQEIDVVIDQVGILRRKAEGQTPSKAA